MENKDFDNILRGKMEGFNPPVNPAHVAKTKVFVMSKLATKSIFLTTAFWGSISGIAAVVVSGILYFSPVKENSSSPKDISKETIQPLIEKEIITDGSIDKDPIQKTEEEVVISNEPLIHKNQKPTDPYETKQDRFIEKEINQPELTNKIEIPIAFNEERIVVDNEMEIIEINALTFDGFPVADISNTCEKVALNFEQKSLKKEEFPIKPKLQFNLGLGYQSKKEGNSYSGILEVSKKNVMLNAGVQFTKLKPVTYTSKVEFERKRGHEFRPPPNERDKNRPKHFHDTNMVKNITQQTNVISIPITLQYKVPVYRGLSIFGGITSQIDVSAKQDVIFEYQTNKHLPPITGKSSGKVSVKPLNTFQTRLGIQQETGRISLRLFPTYTLHVKKTEYNPMTAKFGLGFQMLYRL